MPAPRTLLTDAFRAAVEAAHPDRRLRDALPERLPGRTLVVGAGKAAASMARAVEQAFPDADLDGLVITRYGHAEPTDRIEVVEAAHPVPDAAGEAATARLLERVEAAGDETLILCLVSGGGSALLTAPDGIDLVAKAALTDALLRSGADIHEMNVVRKHLSRVKGGHLARLAAPARLLALVVSDVVGDDLSIIASGPTVPDPSTFGDAFEVLERYRIDHPEALERLRSGAAGDLPETPKPGDPVFARAETRLIAGAQHSLEAAAASLEAAGVRAVILASAVTGEAREVGLVHAAIARQVLEHGAPFAAPVALLSGGETTVTVRARGGRGGRNSEFALGFALGLPDGAPVHALAADTDGVDGSEANAGVFVAPELFERVPRATARARLDANDSWAVFDAADLLFVTGPTRTNVNDLRIVLLPG